jgi:hypothetical protein
MDLSSALVRKPWGHEYLCYRNEVLAIWLLNIEYGRRTSLHCHPKKHTGFVVLDGSVKLRFLRGESELKGLDKIHIFRARFHSTEALSVGGAFILEVETPEDKHDLVRLEDAYGRTGQHYEGVEHFTERPVDALWIPEPTSSVNHLSNVRGCSITHFTVPSVERLIGHSEHDVFILTRGGIQAEESGQILWPGDVVDGFSLGRLARAFTLLPGTTILQISKHSQL